MVAAESRRRETALSLAKFGSVTEVRLPYLDNDLVDALLAAPPELKLDDRAQTHILRKRRPAFLDVVNANAGTRMGAGRLRLLLALMIFETGQRAFVDQAPPRPRPLRASA